MLSRHVTLFRRKRLFFNHEFFNFASGPPIVHGTEMVLHQADNKRAETQLFATRTARKLLKSDESPKTLHRISKTREACEQEDLIEVDSD